jgi:hypothetical protein
MKSTEVCVNASLAIKVVVPATGSDKADALFDKWAGEETQLIAQIFRSRNGQYSSAKGVIAKRIDSCTT